METLVSTHTTAAAQHPTRNTQDTLVGLGAAELARRIAAGETSSAAVVEAHIARMEAVNPALNAAVVKLYDQARAQAKAADARQGQGLPLGPLHGVPITIKECLDVAGTPSSFGLPSRKDARVAADDVYVARLRAAGAIPLAKTNVAQLLFYYESDNPVYGRTNHPTHPDRSPGGSSGGEAALIASGASPLGLGTDLGGSVRIPSAFCGITGLKATAGRFPDSGRGSVAWGQRAIASQVGVLAPKVADVTLGLRVMEAGRDNAVDPAPALGDPARIDVAGLHVAYFEDDGVFAPAPGARRAVREAAEALRRRGVKVTAWKLPDGRAALDLCGALLFGDNGAGFRALLGKDKAVPQLKDLMALSRLPGGLLALLRSLLGAIGQQGMAENLGIFGQADAAEYWRNVEAQSAHRERFTRALDELPGGPADAILCPPCALPAFTHGASRDLVTAGIYAILFNLLGWPAGVVPFSKVRPDEEIGRATTRDKVGSTARKVEQGSAGLPLGVQIAARPWREDMVLALLAVLEAEGETGPRV